MLAFTIAKDSLSSFLRFSTVLSNMSFHFSVIFFTFFLLFRCSDGLTLRPIYSHIDKRLIGEAPRGFGAKDFFLDRSQESPASRSDGVSIHLLSYLLFTFFLCCQNSILLVYLHLSSYNELTGHCHVQVNKEGEHYFGNT